MSARNFRLQAAAEQPGSAAIARKFSELVVLPHSVFALPFALAALVLAAGQPDALPLTAQRILLVVLALVSARTAAMSFNRLVDAKIDSKNPRTRDRHLPRGTLTAASVWSLFGVAAAVFFLSAGLLGSHCLILAPAVFAVLLGYSLTKRFTMHSHLVLGLALALAPGGAWWVLVPRVAAVPLLLMSAVLLWVAGFDILYSCQDYSFDLENGLHSIPARFGIGRALEFSAMLHLGAALLFFAVGAAAHLGATYFWGASVIALILLGQHRLVAADDLSRVNRAFFTFNGVVSVAYFFVVLAAQAS